MAYGYMSKYRITSNINHLTRPTHNRIKIRKRSTYLKVLKLCFTVLCCTLYPYSTCTSITVKIENQFQSSFTNYKLFIKLELKQLMIR